MNQAQQAFLIRGLRAAARTAEMDAAQSRVFGLAIQDADWELASRTLYNAAGGRANDYSAIVRKIRVASGQTGAPPLSPAPQSASASSQSDFEVPSATTLTPSYARARVTLDTWFRQVDAYQSDVIRGAGIQLALGNAGDALRVLETPAIAT